MALGLVLLAGSSATAASGAAIDDPTRQWLPSVGGATWNYEWSDSVYAPVPTRERYTMTRREDAGFLLSWSSVGLDNPEGSIASVGRLGYRRTPDGLVNPALVSNPTLPGRFPSLCGTPVKCRNSLASTHLMLVWGSRAPVLAEPLVRGTRWRAVGGATGGVRSTNRYAGRERVVVGAFPGGVEAAKVVSTISRARSPRGAYGNGTRTVWWVFGVGPVKIVFDHPGAPVTRAELKETNLVPRPVRTPRPRSAAGKTSRAGRARAAQAPAPSDESYFPLVRGEAATLRWRNSKHLRRASTQRFTVAETQGNSARVDVKDLSGPILVRGGYAIANRLDGLASSAAFVRSATRARLPALGPRSVPKRKRRRFATPYDLMTFGFNPILPAFPKAGDAWTSTPTGPDFSVYGVTGGAQVLGLTSVRVPAGTFRAMAVRSELHQPGFPFGSGTRTSYFARGKGLVKLVFRHGDRSVSTVERVR